MGFGNLGALVGRESEASARPWLGECISAANRSIWSNADRHLQDVVDGLEEARQLDAEAPGAGVEGTGGDDAVGARHPVDDVAGIEVVAFEHQGIDQQFNQLVAVAGNLRLQHLGNALDLVLEVARQAQQCAFRHLPGEA